MEAEMMTEKELNDFRVRLSQLALVENDLRKLKQSGDYGRLASEYQIHTEEDYDNQYSRIKSEMEECDGIVSGKLIEVETKQYKFISADPNGTDSSLNELLQQGWEIVSAYPGSCEKDKQPTGLLKCKSTNYVLSKIVHTYVKGINEHGKQ
jgi:hypothetical protein